MRKRLGSLLPTYVDPDRPELMQGEYTLGGLAASYFEYLIKQAQLISNQHPQYSRMYEGVANSVLSFLMAKIEVVPGRDGLTNLGVRVSRFGSSVFFPNSFTCSLCDSRQQWGKYSHTWEHLTCFAGGMLGLGSRILDRPFDLEVAQNVSLLNTGKTMIHF